MFLERESDMKASRVSALWSLLLGGFLPLALFFLCEFVMPNWQAIYEPFHSLFESLGLFAGLSLALLLLMQQDREREESHYIWILSGLIAMGILDGFHAAVSLGNGFVWLHTMAVLCGGFLFCMIWIPLPISQPWIARAFAACVAAGALLLGVFSLVFPDAQPPMLLENHFTLTAKILNAAGGFLFVVAGLFFLIRHWRRPRGEETLFAFFCFLNGSAALLFPFGSAWQAGWWLWHLLRLVAYLIVLGYIFGVFRDLSERQRMAELLEKRTVELSVLLQKVRETINVLAASSSEILASTTQVASGTAETATSISETTTTVEEVRQAARLSADKAKNVADNAQRVAQVSQSGQKAVEEAAAGMLHIRKQMESIAQTIVQLSEQSQSIGGIIASVTDLADQSNLLAVNAAIEAARAGEEGKAFAIVAQEIRSLAEQSKQATAQVRSILGDVQKATSAAVMATEQGSKAVEAGVQQSARTGEAIRVLAESTGEAAQVAVQIVASSQQQVVGMDQIGVAMENINQAGTQTAASMQQAETAAQNLHELGQRLKDLVEQVKT